MSERAIAFVEEWVSENIHATGYEPEGDAAQAAAFAAQCLASAKAEGITDAEMKDAFVTLISSWPLQSKLRMTTRLLD